MRYKKNTPPPKKGYPPVGKTSLVIADLLARVYGLDKPEMSFQPVNIKELVDAC